MGYERPEVAVPGHELFDKLKELYPNNPNATEGALLAGQVTHRAGEQGVTANDIKEACDAKKNLAGVWAFQMNK